MADIKDFFQPIASACVPELSTSKSWAKKTDIHIYDFPSLEGAKIALFGIDDGAMDRVRLELFRLVQPYQLKIVDLGNIVRGASIEDTGYAITETCKYLLDERILPIVITNQDIWGYYIYKAFENYGSYINLSHVSSTIDIWDVSGDATMLSSILSHQPNYLFNYAALGYQSYFTESETIQSIQKMFFDAYRLGWVNQNMEEVEPIFRSSDLLYTNVNSIRLSDFQAQHHGSPNGFFGDEICRLMRYAGMSNKMNTLYINGYAEELDNNSASAKLLAQMIWYFVDGVMARQPENPEESEDGFLKYVVGIKENAHEINFYKSKRTEKWWMEIPNPMNKAAHHGPIVVPCSYQDYIKASNDELPERWWNIYQKLM